MFLLKQQPRTPWKEGGILEVESRMAILKFPPLFRPGAMLGSHQMFTQAGDICRSPSLRCLEIFTPLQSTQSAQRAFFLARTPLLCPGSKRHLRLADLVGLQELRTKRRKRALGSLQVGTCIGSHPHPALLLLQNLLPLNHCSNVEAGHCHGHVFHLLRLECHLLRHQIGSWILHFLFLRPGRHLVLLNICRWILHLHMHKIRICELQRKPIQCRLLIRTTS